MGEEGNNSQVDVEFRRNLRDYQEQIINLAQDRNLIIYLPTGSGKTFIAIEILKMKSAVTRKKLNEGGKRSVFLVNTRALVEQQAGVIKMVTSLKVGQYTGDMKVDFWTRKKWENEFEQNQVLVMVGDILKHLLETKMLSLEQINLLIFDECHRGVGESAYRCIMREFEHIDEVDRPSVIGLSATLLNSNVESNKVTKCLSDLEVTFLSTVATVEDMDKVVQFSANPNLVVIEYSETEMTPCLLTAKGLIDSVLKRLKRICLPCDKVDEPIKVPSPRAVLDVKFGARKWICNTLLDIIHHIDSTGLTGSRITILHYLIQFERESLLSDNLIEVSVYELLGSLCSNILKLYTNELIGADMFKQIYEFSSPKVLSLLKFILSHKEKISEQNEELKCIIFVDRRVSTYVLYHIFANAVSCDKNLSFIKPDFMTGGQANPLAFTRESVLEKHRNEETLKRFRENETNLLIATDVAEEGVDISQCNLVVKFDLPKDFRNYIQSKGRARKKGSTFVLFTCKENKRKLEAKIKNYHEIENLLQGLLVGRRTEYDTPSEEQLSDLYFTLLPTYFVDGESGTHITAQSAIPLLTKYCSMLPQDLFTCLSPVWWYERTSTDVTCHVQLPNPSPLWYIVSGDPMPNKQLAKRSVAMKVCKLLIEMGEINTDLKPCIYKVNDVMEKDREILFPYWIDEKPVKRPGTKARIQSHPFAYAECLANCKPTAGDKVYLHIINMKPLYDVPRENRHKVFYDLLISTHSFGLLSSKPWAKICDFPLFTSMGEIQCNLTVNSASFTLNEKEMKKVEEFHFKLFYKILTLVRDGPSLVFDTYNQNKSYIVVPVLTTDNDIDWGMVNCVLAENEKSLVHKSNLRNLSVVIPRYRYETNRHPYIVTKVCDDMSPLTEFPSDTFTDYKDYFESKYENVKIHNLTQPMLEVKVIPIRINYLTPRLNDRGGIKSRKRQQEENDDYKEHLIPELCSLIDFPAVLCLKSTYLPSALHRIETILHVEQFRKTLVKLTNIGCENVDRHEGIKINPLYNCMGKQNSKTSKVIQLKFAKNKPNIWLDEKEPADLIKNLENISVCDLKYYVDFVNKKDKVRRDSLVNSNMPERNVCELSVLEKEYVAGEKGIELCELTSATTCAVVGDIINMERYETLGDSFLKFATSLFLYRNYSLNEGVLTCVKGRIIGNRNLLYCALKFGLPTVMSSFFVSPKTDWCPPLFTVVPHFKKRIVEDNLSIGILYDFELSEEERFTGVLSPETEARAEEVLLKAEKNSKENSSEIEPTEIFVGRKSIRDKNLADCVEAIIGVNVYSCGVRSGFILLERLQILPPKISDPSVLLDTRVKIITRQEESVDETVNLLLSSVDYELLETILGYKFTNRIFLLQALTHASYTRNRLTESYERLEFLGDALLDFLITTYIFEKCEKMTPGQITDLRSALVNNITFACLAVKYNLHKFLLSSSSLLMDAIMRFVKLQEARDHIVDDAVLILLAETDCTHAETVDVPKALGDVFESIAGAIFLDSGNCVKTVWNVYYNMLKNEIDLFSANVPIHPVRKLKELRNDMEWTFHGNQNEFRFGLSHISVKVNVLPSEPPHTFHGYGVNKRQAKISAAKIAVRYIEKLN